MLEMKALAEATALIVKQHVAEAVTPLLARIETLENAPPQVDEVIILQLVQDEIAKIPPAENGKDADPEQVASLIAEEVERAVAAIPVPQDGKSVGVEDVAPLIIEEVAKVAPDMAAINAAVADQVSKAVAEIPVPKDGEPGKDAAGIVEALKDSGELVLTLQDGRLIRTGVRDGEKGQDGRDGLELSDYDEWFEDDGRTLVRRFVVGEDYKEFRHQTALPVYRNVFKEGQTYQPADVVTWGGAAWYCEKETTEKPVAGECWVKMVNKGRDGKDAKNG